MPFVEAPIERTPIDGYNYHEFDHVQDSDLIEPIAVIGFALKGPGDATTADSFWEMLVEGRSGASEFPSDRIILESFYRNGVRRSGELPMRRGHFIQDDIRAFDAGFFSISPAEASSMDPMQRLLLETAYHGFENAGIPLHELIGSDTSVYTGCFTTDYLIQLTKDPLAIPTYAATGTGASILANRISWFFNLKGPSVNMDSACSSSGMALDLACENLRNGTTKMSLVGGCNLTFAAEYFTMLTNLNMLSKDGQSHSFDPRANGYARGEGFGTVVLKRMSDAISHGDTIRAVIRSTGCNHDGRTPGITQPSSTAQEELVRETYRKAGLSMEPTRFCETHGTGTSLGDPIESMALGRAFQDVRSPADPLILGALKSNIGHLEGASGIAGLIKTIMVLENGLIPPNFDFQGLNPKIDAEYLGIKVFHSTFIVASVADVKEIPEQVMEWPSDGLRRASINSFGFGGSNSHVVVDDAYNFLRLHNLRANHRTIVRHCSGSNGSTNGHHIESGPSDHPHDFSSHDGHFEKNGFVDGHTLPDGLSKRSRVNRVTNGSGYEHCHLSKADAEIPKTFVFSANSEEALGRVLSSYQPCFKNYTFPTSDLAYTLDSRRSHLPWRSHLTVTTPDDLTKINLRGSIAWKIHDKKPRLGFVFTGQGAQWFGMGRELMLYPIFEESVKAADKHLRSLGCPWSAIKMFTSHDRISIDDPTSSQTLCTVLQVALVDLLSYCGVKPCAVVGHSSGEIAAAYCSGAISRESAWSLAYHRGYHAQTLPTRTIYRGTMIAVGLSEPDARPFLEQVVQHQPSPWALRVACYNSPRSITISGPSDQVDHLKTLLDGASVFNRILRVPVAYHSPQMEVIAVDYRDSIGVVPNSEMQIPMVSSVTGKPATSKALQRAQYWVDNMVSAVRFDEAVERLCAVSPKTLTKKLDKSHLMTPAVDLLLEIGPHAALKGPILDILKMHSRGFEIEYDFAISRNVSGAETVHQLIGRMHCRGYNVDLRHVNDPLGTSRVVVTNLPAYPFDRSQTYWYESRMNRDYRLKEYGHQEFLGSRSLDWCPLAPQWRYFIRMKELPWVEDHKINGATLYPASGMLVMAAEAARQMTASTADIEGYQFRNVQFTTALNIPSSRGELEVRIGMRPLDYHDHGFAYALYSIQGEAGWVENSRGEIQVYMKTTEGLSHTVSSMDPSQAALTCDTSLDLETFYQYLWEMGYGYGPSFQLIRDIRHDSKYSKVLGQIHPLITDTSPDSIVHPATLDAIKHLEFAILFKAGKDRAGTFIPTKIDSLWLSDKGLNANGSPVNAVTMVQDRSQRHARGSCQVFSQDYGRTLLQADGIELTMVASSSNKESLPLGHEHTLNYVCAKVDVDMLDSQQLKAYLAEMYPTKLDTRGKRKIIRQFILLSLKNVDLRLAVLNATSPTPHGRAYLDWARSELQRSDAALPDADWQKLEYQLSQLGAEGRLIAEVNKCLLDVLLDRQSPTELLFGPDRLLANYYSEQAQSEIYFKRILEYISLLAYKRPNLRILEVGGGTGTFTSYILEALKTPGADETKRLRCASYDFTDIGPAFIDQAKSKFDEYDSKMTYKVLDIESDPESQGFQKGTYDIVIAVSVLHATQNLGETLKNVRRLLKPGGKLVLQEADTPTDPFHCYAWGVFPGWWRAIEESRKLCPLADQATWHRLLVESGFTGTDIIMRDYEDDESHQMSFIISHASADGSGADSMPKSEESPIKLIVKHCSTTQLRAAEILQNQLLASGYAESKIITLSDILNNPGVSVGKCISLLEIGEAFMTTMSDEQYNGLQKLLKKASILLWVSHGGGKMPQQPGFQMVDGFARSFRLEAAQLKLVHLALEPSESLAADQVQNIMRVLKMTTESDSYEHEVIERDNRLHVQRVVEQPALRQEFLTRMQPQRIVERQIAEHYGLRLEIGVPGQLETLAFTADTEPNLSLGNEEVEIQVKAVGLSYEDQLIATARSDAHSFGRDCAGVVVRVGEGCKLQPGQRVWMHTAGRCGSLARSSEHAVVTLPESISFEQACALPSDVVTAAHAIQVVAKLETGDTVLLDCTGPLLRSALHFSKTSQLNIFVLAYSSTEKANLEKNLGLPPHSVLLSMSPFQHQFRKLNGGCGADAVISTRANPACMEVLSSFGTYLHISKDKQSFPSPSFTSNITLVNLNMDTLAETRPKVLQPALQSVLGLCSATKHDTTNIFSSSNLVGAFEKLAKVDNGEKVVLTFDSRDRVQTKISYKETYSLDDNSTYVISGAFGGLGQIVARWLAGKGAKHMILISRSGPRTEKALTLVAELQGMGVILAMPMCNITVAHEVQEAIHNSQQSMPPIRGCMHLAVSGKDMVFENMPYSEWVNRTSAKGQGTANLHAALPSDLDFFIMTASVGGHSGNAYQDNFARYLVGKGQKAVAIDYGAAEDIGMLAGQDSMFARLMQTGQYTAVTDKELLALLEYYCDPEVTVQQVEEAQPIIGIQPPGRLLAKGKEVPEGMKHSFWNNLYGVDASSASGADIRQASRDSRSANLKESIVAAPSLAEAEHIVVDALIHRVAKTTSIPPEKVDAERPIHSYGVDSLTAIDLRNWIASAFEYDIAVFEILSEASFKGVGASIARKSWEGK